MRNRILAGVGVAALATVGIAAPAAATTAGTADLYVVHGFPGEAGTFPVDIYANGSPVDGLQGVDFGDFTAEPLALPADTYALEVFAAGTTEAPALELEATLAAGDSVTVVAHADADGAPVINAFPNNVSEIAAGEARLTVRHTAAAPAVDVLSDGAVVAPFENVANPGAADLDLAAGVVPAVAVAATGTTDPVIGPIDLDLAAGTNTLVHAIGSLEQDNLELAVITIDGLGAAPEGVPAGSAGLVAEGGNAGLIGAGVALMLAALAAVGIVVRRKTVSAER